MTKRETVFTTPKRKAPGSNPGGNATINAESLCFQGLSVFLYPYYTRHGFSIVGVLFYFGRERSIPENS